MSKVFKAVGNAISSVVKGVVKAVSSVVKAVVNVVSSVVNFVTQPFMGLLGGMPDVPSASAEAERQQGVMLQREGSNVAVPVVYGYRKVGGIVTFAETGSTNNRYLYVAYVFSEGLVEGLREVFIDDWQLPATLTANLNAGQRVVVNADRYKDRVELQWYPGVYFQNPASSPVGSSVKSGIFAEAPSFKDTMDYNGLAVLFARYEWKEIKTQADADANPFGGGIPRIQVSMLGRKVASLTVTDTESQSYDSTTVRYSTNPAEILLDYLRNPRYGKGLKNEDLDWDSWRKSARKCNQIVTYLNTTGDITGPIMTCNTVLDTGQTIMNNVKTLLMGFRAYMPYVQGKYRLRIEDAGNETDITSGVATIVMTAVAQPFLKSSYTGNVCDIIGTVTYTGIDKSAKYTSMTVSYVDPDQKFSVQEVIYPETEEDRQVYINRDGGRENPGQATFPTLTNYAMAKDMARLLFNKSRRQETCSLTISSEGLELEPGDNIRIQANILNFGTDPWRVVSIKVNDNMTVDIGCVRNPDDIYPYVRVGEEDIVLAVYVPKGSIIYYPSSNNQPLLGLVPPTRAVYPEDFTPVNTNPGPTNPEGNTGGGVGGADNNGNTPVQTPVNDPAQDPPPPPPFEPVMALKSSRAVDLRNGSFNFNLIFAQPTDGLYDHCVFWWRVNRFTAYTEIKIDAKPGPGGDIPVNFGPLPAGDYDFYIRAFATDGRASTKVNQGRASIRANSAELNPNLTGIASIAQTIVVAEGWTVPQAEVPTAPRYDDSIAVFELRPKLVAGVPQDPRKITATMRQLGDTFSSAPNPLITGVRVYYKYKDDQYWSYEDHPITDTNQLFTTQTWDLAGEFGSRNYPTAFTGDPLAVAWQLQQYDFLVRLRYAGDTPALKQLGPARGPVEYRFNPTDGYNFAIFGTDPYASGSVRSVDIPLGFNENFRTTDQDPNQSYNSAAAIVPNINRISSTRSDNVLAFFFNPPTPTNSKFRGYKIRWREITPGANPDFNETTVGVAQEAGSTVISARLNTPNYKNGVAYQWVITAQYSNNGVLTDCTDSLYALARVLSDDPDYQNLYAKFDFEIKNSEEALGTLRSAFPAQATVNALKWEKVRDFRFDGNRYGEIDTNTGRINHYYRLTFQVPAGTTHIICYRRVFDAIGLSRSTTGAVAKYQGLGAWERQRVALSSLTPLASGAYELNFRGPISPTYYNNYYQVSGRADNANLLFSRYSPLWPNNPSAPTTSLSGVRPYFGAGNRSTTDTTGQSYCQYLFVLEDALGEANKGLLLRDFYVDLTSATVPRINDGFIVGGVNKFNVIDDVNSAFNSVDAGYDRRLSEALTNTALNRLENTVNITYPGRTVQSYTAAFDRFLQAPSGVTIY